MRQKERQRNAWELERKKAKRAEAKRILLGCEGETEVAYFNGFRRAHKVPVVCLHFTECGHDPSSLLREVEEKFSEEAGDFDAVYCVFDRDDHPHFDSTCQTLGEMRQIQYGRREPVPIQAFTSNPSFELWLLLHFEDVRRELHRDEIYRCLRDHLPDYKKASATIYELTCGHLEVAIERAGRLPSGKNPSTAVGKLIQEMRRLWNLGLVDE